MIDYLERQQLPALKQVEKWDNEYGVGLKITTSHYQIFTTLMEPLMLTQIPGFVESAYRGYQKQLPLPIETEETFTVYLFAKRGQWEDFNRNFTGRQASLYNKIKAGAYYLNGAIVSYNIGRERTFSALGHEGWHQFNNRHFKYRLPSWLDEGVAMMFEACRFEDGLFYFEPQMNYGRLVSLKDAIVKKHMLSLRALIALNPGEIVQKDDPEAVATFYAQLYGLIRFLKEDNYGNRLGNYYSLLMDGFEGKWPLDELLAQITADRRIPLTIRWNSIVGPKLFQTYIDEDFEKLNDEYVIFCKKIVYRIYLSQTSAE